MNDCTVTIPESLECREKPIRISRRKDIVLTYAAAKKPPTRIAPYVAGTLTMLQKMIVSKKNNWNTETMKEDTRYEEMARGREKKDNRQAGVEHRREQHGFKKV